MTHPQTIADLERILDQIDSELAKLRALVAKGEELREVLFKQITLATWEQGDPSIVRIVRNDP